MSASVRSDAATRPGDSKATTVSGDAKTPRGLGRLARQEADEPPAVGRQRAGHERRERRRWARGGPRPRARRRRTPARARSPGRTPAASRRRRRARRPRRRASAPRARPRARARCARGSETSVAPDAVAVEQHPRAAGVLAGDDVGVAQRAEHAQRDVLEVPDRRRADDEPAGLTPRVAGRVSGVRSPAASRAIVAAPSIPASAPNAGGDDPHDVAGGPQRALRARPRARARAAGRRRRSRRRRPRRPRG